MMSIFWATLRILPRPKIVLELLTLQYLRNFSYRIFTFKTGNQLLISLAQNDSQNLIAIISMIHFSILGRFTISFFEVKFGTKKILECS